MKGVESKPKIMQGGTGQEDFMGKLVFTQTTLVFENAVAFDTADGVFNADPKSGNNPVGLFLLSCQFFTTRLFHRLLNGYAFRTVALIAGILPEGKAFRNRIVRIGQLLIVGFTRNGGTYKQDQAQRINH